MCFSQKKLGWEFIFAHLTLRGSLSEPNPPNLETPPHQIPPPHLFDPPHLDLTPPPPRLWHIIDPYETLPGAKNRKIDGFSDVFGFKMAYWAL